MTKQRKILLVGIVLAILLAVLTVNALADASATEDGAISYADGPTEVAPETHSDTEDTAENAAHSADTTDIEKSAGSTNGEDENPMAQAFATVKEHLAEILSALTLAGSLILALAFKKGLLPLVCGALGRLGESAREANVSAKATAEQTEAIKEELTLRTVAIEGATADVLTAVAALGEEVRELKEQGLDKRLLYNTLGSEIELLYDIFMSSSLPNFQKEAVSQRLNKMKEELRAGEEK